MICRQVFVSGRVQGVGFRYFTQREASRLGLAGYAHNLEDGRVEVMVKGEPDKVEQLLSFLQHGSPMARVSQIKVQSDVDWQGSGFFID
ncbi:acylphosphatase [Celerinatantimonas yamalensis]|uniref:acylphosphatase n=1 Tax=Celerinatantimonas yamalensis TaxID=559956 RepID=A0ABW9G2U8_9GAMM